MKIKTELTTAQWYIAYLVGGFIGIFCTWTIKNIYYMVRPTAPRTTRIHSARRTCTFAAVVLATFVFGAVLGPMTAQAAEPFEDPIMLSMAERMSVDDAKTTLTYPLSHFDACLRLSGAITDTEVEQCDLYAERMVRAAALVMITDIHEGSKCK